MLQRLKLGESGLTESPQKSPQVWNRLKRTPLNPRRKKPVRKARIDYSQFPIAKLKKPVPPYWEYPDGRIVYNLRHPQGHLLYMGAIAKMWERQGKRCSIGGEVIPLDMGTFDHGDLRGAGGSRRNDNPDVVGPDGFYQNSCACAEHNLKRGSRRDYPMKIRIKANE